MAGTAKVEQGTNLPELNPFVGGRKVNVQRFSVTDGLQPEGTIVYGPIDLTKLPESQRGKLFNQ